MIAELRASFVLVQFFFLQIKVQLISYTIVYAEHDVKMLFQTKLAFSSQIEPTSTFTDMK